MAGRYDIRLRERVKPCRPARTVGRHIVVAVRDGTERVDGADGDCRRRIARRRDACVPDHAGVRIDADIPRRNDHDKTGADRALNGLHERVVGGGRQDDMAE